MTTTHSEKIARLAAQLRAHDGSKPVSLRKKAVAHQVPKPGDLRKKDAKVDASDLTEVLAIDVVARTATVESGVTFVDLVGATLPHGLVPIVVPELKTITVGGAVSGCSIESMSFVHGGFHDTCTEYEVVSATGEVIVCKPGELIFEMIHGAFGTLGVLTKLTCKLVPAKPYVRLTYETYGSIAAYVAAMRAHAAARDVDFMDGIIHAPDKCVLALGTFVDSAPYTSDYSWMKIYWESTLTRKVDYLDTASYFFRYDRGVTNVRPNSFVARLLFGKFMASTQWLTLGDKLRFLLPRKKPTITLDTFVPMARVEEFMEWYAKTFQFFPLWAVPYKRVRDYAWLDDRVYAGNDDDMFLDLAIYGMKQRGDANYHRLMEQKLQEVGGIKTLIAHNYYPEDEFWTIFNRRNYDEVKGRVDPKNIFRDLYTKMCKAAMGIA